jgi:hypothetical protein
LETECPGSPAPGATPALVVHPNSRDRHVTAATRRIETLLGRRPPGQPRGDQSRVERSEPKLQVAGSSSGQAMVSHAAASSPCALRSSTRPRVKEGPMRHIGSARSSVTVGARPLLQTSDGLASRARVLGRSSTRARVDGSMQRPVTWTSRGRTTARTWVRLRRVRVDRLGPGAGYAPRSGHGVDGQRHSPKVLICHDDEGCGPLPPGE